TCCSLVMGWYTTSMSGYFSLNDAMISSFSSSWCGRGHSIQVIRVFVCARAGGTRSNTTVKAMTTVRFTTAYLLGRSSDRDWLRRIYSSEDRNFPVVRKAEAKSASVRHCCIGCGEEESGGLAAKTG